jgi:uncharacterized RDD family membrane protein YckC
MSEHTTLEANPYATGVQYAMPASADSLELASRWARLFAAIIDAVITSVIVVPPAVLYFEGFNEYAQAVRHHLPTEAIMVAIGFLVDLAVNGYFLARTGQSIGKKALGIKIVRSDGSNPGLKHIVMRRMVPMEAIQLVPYFGKLVVLIGALMIFRESKKCLHDEIADTIVVVA